MANESFSAFSSKDVVEKKQKLSSVSRRKVCWDKVTDRRQNGTGVTK